MDYLTTRTEQGHETRRVRRRIGFTIHVVAYVVFSLVYGVLFFPDPLLMMLKSLLLATVVIHAYWLYLIGLYESSLRLLTEQVYATLADIVPESLPLLTDGNSRLADEHYAERDFWFRWHDV